MKSLSKNTLVFLVLALGIGFIFILNEPKTVCDVQVESFREAEAGNIFPFKGQKSIRPPLYLKYKETCKNNSSPGSCLEFFNSIKKTIRNFNLVESKCNEKLGELPEIKRSINDGITIMAMLAWGETPPTAQSKAGWFEVNEIALFCSIKRKFVQFYGEESLTALMDKTFKSLPGEELKFIDGKCTNCEQRKAADVVFDRNQLWYRSLFSINCDAIN